MSLNQQAAHPFQISLGQCLCGGERPCGLRHYVPHSGYQRRRKPPLHLEQIGDRELGQVRQSGTPFSAERQRLLALPPPLVERSPGETMGHARLDHPEAPAKGHLSECSGSGLEEQRRARLPMHRDGLIHAAAAHADLVILRSERDLHQLLGGETLSSHQTESFGQGDRQRSRGGESSAQRKIGRYRNVGARRGRPQAAQLAHDSDHIVGPRALHLGVDVNLSHARLLIADKGPPIRCTRSHTGSPLDRDGQHRASVIIGMLPYQIDSPRCRRGDRGTGGKAARKQRSCQPCRRPLADWGSFLSGGTVGHCVRRLGVIAWLVIPARVSAQLAPVGVPGGAVRVELDGSLESFDDRFRDGNRESYAADLASPALGSDRIPGLAASDARLDRILGTSGYHLNLGALAAEAHADVGTGFLGLSLGLTNRITIFGRLPLVQTRVQPHLTFNTSSADAGINPGTDAQAAFFSEFDAALTQLSDKLAAGDYDANPTQRALAEATLADATTLRTDLFGLLGDPATASPFVPTTGSSAGIALDSRIVTLQGTLANQLDVPGFSATPTLPDERLTEDDASQYFTNGLQLRLDERKVTFRGDAEAGASITLVDRWDVGRQRGGFRAAVSGLARFPTGRVDRPESPLDIGTGSSHTDLQGDVVVDIGAGTIGARLTGRYVRQLPSTILVRVTAPSQPLVGPDRTTLVRRDPGDIIAFSAHPFFRLARTFALQAGVEHWTRKSDVVSFAGTPIPGVDASIMAEESNANATVLSLGVTYANPGGLRPGGTGMPVDASWSYERVIQAGGGRVPDSHAVRARLRLYFGVW